MKNAKKNNLKNTIVVMAILLITVISCERNLSDEAVFAEFGNNAEIFTDAPVGLTDEFFTSFDPAQGANVNGFGTDNNEAYAGSASIRIDVPSANDPNGGFIGGIFKDRGLGRNLTGFDALTFWAKGSTTATIGLVGFGSDFVEDKYAVGLENIVLSTGWKKYTIPFPDPSKLIQEKGMFVFSAGSDSTGGNGYTFWIDEIKFEKLGTIAQPRPSILNGVDLEQLGFVGTPVLLSGLKQTFNLASGENVTVNAAPSYFNFESSDIESALVSELGVVSIIGDGSAVITASLAGYPAQGSLTISSAGAFDFAPTPPARDPNSVIAIFSDAYNQVEVDYYNGFFTPDGQTTQGGEPPINFGGDNVINYTDLNFVGIGTFLNVPTIDASQMTHIHVDINVQETLNPGDFIRLQLLNGVQTANEISGSKIINGSELISEGWMSFDIPLSDFSGLTSKDSIGLLFFISDSTISNIYVDNIYFYN